ncbi:hypothetical protein F9B77_08725 [Staphylococcus epidermidis]|uniref:Uncharacterized protein n=2 Tax=Staphylococcus TaxID=1279 RepID=A0A0H2VID7_STAES|nr:hypothetical protein SE_2155 [Staphylococcus epidermidis ATCC 12228]AVA10758.1 hypothetical protein AL514_03735 [Staphylococcus epidermidis]MBA9941385.1 hypothetical protein [Ralstonia insidiosa]MCZ2499591.1 hypothetical protein [Xylophilus sp. Kf1]TBW67606.1 hypothetical protein EQ812_14810 [Staphylococcus lugdunensis]
MIFHHFQVEKLEIKSNFYHTVYESYIKEWKV